MHHERPWKASQDWLGLTQAYPRALFLPTAETRRLVDSPDGRAWIGHVREQGRG